MPTAFDTHAAQRADLYASLSNRDLAKALAFQNKIVEHCATSAGALRSRLGIAEGIRTQIEAVIAARSA